MTLWDDPVAEAEAELEVFRESVRRLFVAMEEAKDVVTPKVYEERIRQASALFDAMRPDEAISRALALFEVAR